MNLGIIYDYMELFINDIHSTTNYPITSVLSNRKNGYTTKNNFYVTIFESNDASKKDFMNLIEAVKNHKKVKIVHSNDNIEEIYLIKKNKCWIRIIFSFL